MYEGKSYTENELGKKIQEIEEEIKSIFNKKYIPSFLSQRAVKLIIEWKLLTNWKEDETPAFKESNIE